MFSGCSGNQLDLVAKLVNGKTPEPLFAGGQASMLRGSLPSMALRMSVVVTWDQPDRANRVKAHSMAVVSDRDRAWPVGGHVHAHFDVGGVGVVRVLDKLKDRETSTANEFVAK